MQGGLKRRVNLAVMELVETQLVTALRVILPVEMVLAETQQVILLVEMELVVTLLVGTVPAVSPLEVIQQAESQQVVILQEQNLLWMAVQ